jgi:hypothetical protein
LQNYNQYLIAAIVAMSLLAVEAALGRRIPTFGLSFFQAILLSLALVGIAASFWKLEAAIALLGGLAMYGNPTVFRLQGRAVSTLHLLGGLVIVAWVLRRIVVEKSLRILPSPLNKPLLALVTIWLVSWIAGYTFWDIRVPTAHRQPLFFVAEFGQLLMFIGVFWAVADTVKSDQWAKIICATIIVVNASTPILGNTLAWNQFPVALALTCSLLAFGKVDLRVKGGLWLILGIFLWGLIRVNRIPVYLASMAVVLAVSFLKSRWLFALMLIVFVILGVAFIRPLWNVEASVSSRLELARLAWSMFLQHPILGIGPTHYRSYAILYHPGWWKTVESGMLLPHDVWLYFLANVGVVGFLGVLWVVGAMLRGPFSAYRRAENAFSRSLAVSALVCVAGVLVQSAGGHMGFLPDYGLASFYMVPVWILMGLMAARAQEIINEGQDG